MLQPSAIPTGVSSELTESLQQTLSANRIRTLNALGMGIPLPNNLKQFLLFLLAVSIICAGLTMQILLSIQIWQATARVERLRAEYLAVEQQNTTLVWEIAQQSTLAHVQQRAAALGYNVALNRYYVPAQPSPQVASAALHPNPPALPATMDRQATQGALRVDTALLSAEPELGFVNKLQKAGHAFEQWWQKQWQKLLRKS